MTLDEFNQADAAQVRAFLLCCVAIPGWADAVTLARPYASREALILRAGDLAAAWEDADVDQALAAHPRIGERAQQGTDAAGHSRREQAAVDDADAALTAALREGNLRYERQFNRVFLIRAAGRSGEEILAVLHQRLHHSALKEQRETAAALREITLLRLQHGVDQ